jgi:hypothetical protein
MSVTLATKEILSITSTNKEKFWVVCCVRLKLWNTLITHRKRIVKLKERVVDYPKKKNPKKRQEQTRQTRMPSRNRQNLRSRHHRNEPQRRRHRPRQRLPSLRPKHQTRRTRNRKNHQLGFSQCRLRENCLTRSRGWPRVCGKAQEWRTTRAVPSEPAPAFEETGQFLKPYARGTSKTRVTSCASQATQLAASASASLPSLVVTSYVALNLELFYLCATKHYT